MKLLIALTFYLTLFASTAIAQTSQRDLLVDKIESCYTQGTLFSADSPFIERILTSAKSANPSVSSDTWSGIKKELAPALSKIIAEKGGLIDSLLRKSVEKMSDGELDDLARILCAPVYTKFQTAMANPANQQQLAKALFSNTLKFNMAINDVLTRYGLKTVH
jgi:hypothetical protein